MKYILSHSQLKKTEKLIDRKGIHEKRQRYYLTDSDRITKVYKVNALSEICEVTCVSYEIEIEGKWITVVYFDNTHDKLLHRHIYISLDEYIDTIDADGLPKTTLSKKLLTWAIKHLNNAFAYYRRGFIKRSRNYIMKNEIDIY